MTSECRTVTYNLCVIIKNIFIWFEVLFFFLKTIEFEQPIYGYFEICLSTPLYCCCFYIHITKLLSCDFFFYWLFVVVVWPIANNTLQFSSQKRPSDYCFLTIPSSLLFLDPRFTVTSLLPKSRLYFDMRDLDLLDIPSMLFSQGAQNDSWKTSSYSYVAYTTPTHERAMLTKKKTSIYHAIHFQLTTLLPYFEKKLAFIDFCAFNSPESHTFFLFLKLGIAFLY